MSSNKPGRGKSQKKDSNTSKKFNANNKKFVVKDEDLKFYIGDQQAKKSYRTIKNLTSEAQREPKKEMLRLNLSPVDIYAH